MIDYAAHIAAEEAHVRKLAALRGWRRYIEHKVQRMAKDQPAMYGHLPQIVKDIPSPDPSTKEKALVRT